MSFSLEEINTEVACLVQASLGEISGNFLYIALTPLENAWLLTFALEVESETDKEAIEDIVTDFEAMHGPGTDIRVQELVAPRNPYSPATPSRAIYVRKQANQTEGLT